MKYVEGMINAHENMSWGDENWSGEACVSIVVACEDSLCVDLSRSLLNRLMQILPFQTRADTAIREFSAFGFGKDLMMPDPDIVVVAAHGNRELPQLLTGWVEKWAIRHCGKNSALAVIFDQDQRYNPTATDIAAYLKSLAEDYGIDWIEYGSTVTNASDLVRSELACRAQTVSLTLSGIMHDYKDLHRF